MISSLDDLISKLTEIYEAGRNSQTGIDGVMLANAIGIKPSNFIVIGNALYFLDEWMRQGNAGTPTSLSKILRVPVVKQFFQAVFVNHIPKYLVYSRTWKQEDRLPKPKLNMTYLRRKKAKMLNWSGVSAPKYMLDPNLKHLSVTTIAENIDPTSIVFFNSFNSHKSKYLKLRSICDTIIQDGFTTSWLKKVDVKTSIGCHEAADFLRSISDIVDVMERFNYEYEVITLQQEARCRIVRIGKQVLKQYA